MFQLSPNLVSRFVVITILLTSHWGLSTTSAVGPDGVAGQGTDGTEFLQRFVDREEPAFKWSHINSASLPDGEIHELRVTSQQWKGIMWNHAVEVYEPKSVSLSDTALLFVTGGSTPAAPKQRDIEIGMKLANACGACVVSLHQTPNHPLLGGRREDDLISETWLRYLQTKDPDWPLLFPMVNHNIGISPLVIS